MSSLTLRVRTQIGTWRVNNVGPNDTLQALQERLEKEHNTAFHSQGFSSDPKGQIRLPPNSTVQAAGLKNGDMLFATVDENASVAVHEASTGKKTITKDGKIILQDTETSLKSTGFRPGMLPLRSMKMQWTLKEFVSLDDQFTYKIARQEKSNCTIASLNSEAISSFQNYIRMFDFRTIRSVFTI
jgi:nuclear protein localization family protein 4